MSNLAFYREQASLRQVDADAATLDNVRVRNQRAADAWTALADRLVYSDALRAERTSETQSTVVLRTNPELPVT